MRFEEFLTGIEFETFVQDFFVRRRRLVGRQWEVDVVAFVAGVKTCNVKKWLICCREKTQLSQWQHSHLVDICLSLPVKNLNLKTTEIVEQKYITGPRSILFSKQKMKIIKSNDSVCNTERQTDNFFPPPKNAFSENATDYFVTLRQAACFCCAKKTQSAKFQKK